MSPTLKAEPFSKEPAAHFSQRYHFGHVFERVEQEGSGSRSIREWPQ
jgi:hypothetical protein